MWTIQTHNMPKLRSFAGAEAFWNGSPLWKNRDEAYRPLDSRRMKHKCLVKNRRGGYECTLFRTPLVTYYPDSVELIIDSRRSSTAFIRCVAPRGIDLVNTRGQLFWRVNTPEGRCFYTGSQIMVFSAQGEGLWKPENPPDPVEERVYNPKLGAQTRKLLKPYTLWYETTKRLGIRFPNTFRRVNHSALKVLLDEPTNSSNFLALSEEIGPPADAIYAAYKLTGAYSYVPVPPYRLPRGANS